MLVGQAAARAMQGRGTRGRARAMSVDQQCRARGCRDGRGAVALLSGLSSWDITVWVDMVFILRYRCQVSIHECHRKKIWQLNLYS